MKMLKVHVNGEREGVRANRMYSKKNPDNLFENRYHIIIIIILIIIIIITIL